MFLVGLGQDSHCFSANSKRKLILGGVEFSGEVGLEGNSDGDVIIHAICRAIEQAIGGESFSVYADKMNRDGISDSREYLKVALNHAKEKDYKINNVGISVEGKRPQIILLAGEVRKSLAKILKVKIEKIGINATSGENLTVFGQGKGLQVFVIVSLVKK